MTIKDALINIVDNAFDELDKQPQRVETTDYIRRESVGNLCLKTLEIINGRCYVNMEELLNLVDGIPAADVEPVRHGRWEGYIHSRYCGMDEFGEPVYRDGTVYYCSNPKCRRKTVVKENFCPNCGAKMDLTDTAPEG